MYDYAHRDKFYYDNKDEEIIISINFEDEESPTVLTNTDLYEDEGFEIDETIMDAEAFSFQCCVSSYIRFRTNFTSKAISKVWLDVSKVLDNDVNNPVPIGKFYVDEDSSYISRDGKVQEVVAYDALCSAINSDPDVVTATYNDLSFPVSVKDLRDYMCQQFGLEQESVELICDDILLPKQIGDMEILSMQDILKCIAELNGVFPHIGKNGKLNWVKLDGGNIFDTTLYPSTDLYPGSETYPCPGYSGTYIDIYKDQYKEDSLVWSNYISLPADGIQIRGESGETVYYYREDESINPYTIIGNFLFYGLTQAQYRVISERLYEQIKGIFYVPYQITKMEDPCLEVGDRVCINTQEEGKVISYIFSKRTTGLRVGFEDIQTNGTFLLPQYDKNMNMTNAKLKNLDQRVGNMEKSGSGPLQIQSVAELPASPQLNVLYLIQGTVQEE